MGNIVDIPRIDADSEGATCHFTFGANPSLSWERIRRALHEGDFENESDGNYRLEFPRDPNRGMILVVRYIYLSNLEHPNRLSEVFARFRAIKQHLSRCLSAPTQAKA